MGFRIITDKTKEFIEANAVAIDRALNRMAIDIERLSKAQVPVLHGQLRSSGHHRRLGPLHYDIVYNKEYAAYQEFGGDGKRTVRHYSKPGSKKFFLRDPGKMISDKGRDYIRQETGVVKV